MSDDLDRAANDFVQRRVDEEAGLSAEERQSRIDARGKAARQRHYDEMVQNALGSIADEIAHINEAFVGKFPKLVQASRGNGNASGGVEDSFAIISFGFEQAGGGHDGTTIAFRVSSDGFVQAEMQHPISRFPPNGKRETLGHGVVAASWIRRMVAAFLDKHPV